MRTIDDFALSAQLLKKLYVKRVFISPSSDSLRAIFQAHPKLVVALNHGPMLAPGVVNTVISDIFLKQGGADRVPMGIIWKHFYKVPLLKNLVAYITQVEEAFGLDDFIQQFVEKPYNDLMVMPEGENCCFGDGVNIEPFLSPRFVEIAIRAKVPVLVAVHHGTHVLANPVEVSRLTTRIFKQMMPEKNYRRFRESGLLSLPRFTAGKVPKLGWSFKLYQPQLTESELAEDKAARLEQLWQEADAIRSQMQAMVEQLRQDVVAQNEEFPGVAA